MSDIYKVFKNNFMSVLEKSSAFTAREVRVLWAIVVSVVNGDPFSMWDISERAGRRIGRNFLSGVLKKYVYVQRHLVKILLPSFSSTVG